MRVPHARVTTADFRPFGVLRPAPHARLSHLLTPIVAFATAAAALPVDGRAQTFGGTGKPPGTPIQARLTEKYGQLPLSFEANQGQTDAQVKFLSRGNGYSLYLTDSGAVLSLAKPNSLAKGTPKAGQMATPSSLTEEMKPDVIRMEFAGASRRMHVTGAEQLSGKVNYFIGNDPAKWQANVLTYAKVKYTGVYPGVDLVYYGNQRQLEYDIVVAPGADPKQVRLHFAGVKRLKLNERGDLRITEHVSTVILHKPLIYQIVKGRLAEVNGRYKVHGESADFEIGAYDSSRPLIIDPTLTYSTYLGGSKMDAGSGIAVDHEGNAYIVGTATSTNFPVTPSAFQTADGAAAIPYYLPFVTKLNSTGTALVYSTYLGGTSGSDIGQSIAVDGSGSAYVSGTADSTDFPITSGAFQQAKGPGLAAFVTKFDPTGSSLLYSTFLGGGFSFGYGIVVDDKDDAYVVGKTNDATFPVTSGAFQTVDRGPGGLSYTGFITKVNPEGSALSYSTFLGGSTDDIIYGAALDPGDNVYVTGATTSVDFPVTAGAFQKSLKSSLGNGFVAALNSTGSALLYSTYLGGKGKDGGAAIALDTESNAYVTGVTASIDFPVTPGAFQPYLRGTCAGCYNAFVSKIGLGGSALSYSTYLGGNDQDNGAGIGVDSAGNAYVTGTAYSFDFPLTADAIQSSRGYNSSAFVTALNAQGSALIYSTYFGGTYPTYSPGAEGLGLTLSTSGAVYVAGYSGYADLPSTSGAFQTTNHSVYTGQYPPSNAFASKFNIFSNTEISLRLLSSEAIYGQPLSVSASLSGTPPPTGSLTYSLNGGPIQIALLSGGSATLSLGVLSAGSYALSVSYVGDSNYGSASQSLSFIVAKAVITATAASFSRPYGTANPTLTYALTGFVNGDGNGVVGGSATLTTTATTTSPTGTYPITFAAEALTAANYSFTYVPGALTVTPPGFVPTPTFSPLGGSFIAPQSVVLSDTAAGAVIYYTTDNSTPGPRSSLYTGAIPVLSTETINAVAILDGTESAIASASYTITGSVSCQTIDYSKGFTSSGLSLNGGATVNNNLLQLTDGGFYEARSAFYTTAVPVTSFTTDFTFQLLYPLADGITFTIQSNNPEVVGQAGGGLGYAGIPNSVAVKADLFDNNGEGFDSTGFYVNGAFPSTPSINLFPAGIYLHSGHFFAVHITYANDVTTATITDTVTSKSSSITVPGDLAQVVGSTAYVGFTGGTGALTATQDILTWSYRGGAGCTAK